jgi:Asparagine synthase
MLENLLTIDNVQFADGVVTVSSPAAHIAEQPRTPPQEGRFARAHRHDHQVLLARDKYGLNKLYFAVDHDRGVLAANYLCDLTAAGIDFNTIYAVPAGSLVTVDLGQKSIAVHRYHALPAVAGAGPDPTVILRRARQRLSSWFRDLAKTGTTRVAVCLSGGLDSALIAALARDHLPDVTTYTYGYDDGSGEAGPDVDGAEHLANWLGLPHRVVTADRNDVLGVVPAALRDGQDWRDFNVHCAIVNELLAKAIAGHEPNAHVLTGDLMNEIVGDYTPVTYGERQFYPLPAVAPDRLRIALVRGIQCGDREVGVFAAHGLTVHQPYSLIGDDLLSLPGTVTKPDIIRSLAGDLLPARAYSRPKARAQIGAPTARTGVLPLLVDAGRYGQALEAEFLRAIGAPPTQRLGRRIRNGIYQFPHRFPSEDL